MEMLLRCFKINRHGELFNTALSRCGASQCMRIMCIYATEPTRGSKSVLCVLFKGHYLHTATGPTSTQNPQAAGSSPEPVNHRQPLKRTKAADMKLSNLGERLQPFCRKLSLSCCSAASKSSNKMKS